MVMIIMLMARCVIGMIMLVIVLMLVLAKFLVNVMNSHGQVCGADAQSHQSEKKHQGLACAVHGFTIIQFAIMSKAKFREMYRCKVCGHDQIVWEQWKSSDGRSLSTLASSPFAITYLPHSWMTPMSPNRC